VSFEPAEFVGSESCAECHQEQYTAFSSSGHPFQLNSIENGDPPDFPFSDVDDPPDGYQWEDIRYVVGGYHRKARFVDQQGYLITGEGEATTQFNLANDELQIDEGWVAYHPGEQLSYDCGRCHTTGYSAEGNQGGLPGVIGTWALDGVQCEACHGPGSLHVNAPLSFRPAVDRDSGACTGCHLQGGAELASAADGFIQHHDQYDAQFPGKHALIPCVTCHDPHAGVVQLRAADLTTTQVACENCHHEQAQIQNNVLHPRLNVECTECHMPQLIRSATGDPALFTGDLVTHQVSINPELIDQFVETDEGLAAQPQLSLNFACRDCHGEAAGIGPVLTDEELQEAARDYHSPAAAEAGATPTP
jgi:hypothetical protein